MGSACGAVAAGVSYHVLGAQCTMWSAAVLALIAALAVLITGRWVANIDTRHKTH
jgi:predicted MFS family arabinose efflux permease